MKDFVASKTLRGFILGILVVLIFLLVFKAGTIVGFRKADFSCRWSDNYHKNFAGPEGGFMNGLNDREFMDANGVMGQIIKIDNDTLIIKGRDNMEKVVLIGDKTDIRRFRDAVKSSDLKVDEYVVIIGEPNNDGQIEAKFIRLMPPPPDKPF